MTKTWIVGGVVVAIAVAAGLAFFFWTTRAAAQIPADTSGGDRPTGGGAP